MNDHQNKTCFSPAPYQVHDGHVSLFIDPRLSRSGVGGDDTRYTCPSSSPDETLSYLNSFGLDFCCQSWQPYAKEVLNEDYPKVHTFITNPPSAFSHTGILNAHKFRGDEPEFEKEEIDEFPPFAETFWDLVDTWLYYVSAS